MTITIAARSCTAPDQTGECTTCGNTLHLHGFTWTHADITTCGTPDPVICDAFRFCHRAIDPAQPCPDHRDCCGICCALD